MKTRLLLAALLFLPASTVLAGPKEYVVEDSIDVLEDFASAPEKRIPSALLREASAVIIAPDVMKGGFIVAARHGHGVMLIRQKGGWSDPIFVTLTGGSIGWQVGVSATDLFIVIRNEKSLGRILRGAGKLTIGADASVAAGPVGRDASAATDAQLRAEILSYSRSRGLFAGVALDGDTLQVDHLANDRYYGKRKLSVGDIVGGKVEGPKSATTIKTRLMDWSGEGTSSRPAPPPADKK